MRVTRAHYVADAQRRDGGGAGGEGDSRAGGDELLHGRRLKLVEDGGVLLICDLRALGGVRAGGV
jgi:hypothetical protein